jgi:hypothetical protein
VIALEPGELALTRPCYLATSAGPLLFFSIRCKHYTIGAAAQQGDGMWRRVSNNVLGASAQDWDDEASCYPAVIDLAGTRYMLYCGNGYGRTGFGIALIEGWD